MTDYQTPRRSPDSSATTGSSANGHTSMKALPIVPQMVRPGDLLGKLEQDAEAAHEAFSTGQPRGPVTGLRSLDRELGGLLVPGLHVVHGGPGVGKTAFALQIAASRTFPALFVSCEMGLLELFRRVIARTTGTFLGRLKTGELEPAHMRDLARQAAAAAPELVLADATQAFADPSWIRQRAELVRGQARHLLIVVDTLHLWADSSGSDADEYVRLNAALADLRVLAGQLGCPILIVAERNRASMNRGGISASAGTRKFEYSGESVLEINVDPDARSDAVGELAVTLTIAKNRNGSPGRTIPLLFHGALQRFREAGR